jgi:hypothetical protein
MSALMCIEPVSFTDQIGCWSKSLSEGDECVFKKCCEKYKKKGKHCKKCPKK